MVLRFIFCLYLCRHTLEVFKSNATINFPTTYFDKVFGLTSKFVSIREPKWEVKSAFLFGNSRQEICTGTKGIGSVLGSSVYFWDSVTKFVCV